MGGIQARLSSDLRPPFVGVSIFENRPEDRSPRKLLCAGAGFASDDTATVNERAGIGSTPNVEAPFAAVFKLDVQSVNDAFATHEAYDAATDATGIGQGGEPRGSYHKLNHRYVRGGHLPLPLLCSVARRRWVLEGWGPRPDFVARLTRPRLGPANFSGILGGGSCVRPGVFHSFHRSVVEN